MGVPTEKEDAGRGVQDIRDAHYFENGVTAKHEREGAQFQGEETITDEETARRESGEDAPESEG